MPHPRGRIAVDYRLHDGKLVAVVKLPGGLKGTFEYGGKSYPLSEGENRLEAGRM